MGPAQLDSGHSAYLEMTLQAHSLGLRPLSPCQLRATRDGADVVFTWIRRTRIDGDAWEPVEIPLGAESENYHFEILDGVTLKRAVEVTSPSYRYLAADIAADFGMAPAAFDLSVAQVSASFGRGAILAGSVSL
jgi:hypothetical protein